MTALPQSLTDRCMKGLLRALLLAALAFGLCGAARAVDAVKGDVKVFTDGGYVRLKFQLDSEVDAKVRLSGAIPTAPPSAWRSRARSRSTRSPPANG